MKVTFALCLVLATFRIGPVLSQASLGSNQKSSSQGSPAKDLDAMVDRLEHEITGVANAMSAEKYDFTP